MQGYKEIIMRNLMCLILLIPSLSFAASGSYWKCITKDISGKWWSSNSAYQKRAINLTFDACKKESRFPKTCKTASNACEHYINGVSITPAWRCTALDKEAQSWESIYYNHKDDAAIAAKDYCKSRSSVPDTCYVNMVTCVNVNNI